MGLRETFLEIFQKDRGAAGPKNPETSGDSRFRAGFGEIYAILTGDNDNDVKGKNDAKIDPPDPNGSLK